MCFGGNSEKTTNTTQATTYTPNPAVADAATQNLNFAQNLQNTGFTPYTGQRVADFSDLQNTGFGQAGATAQSGTDWTNAYGNAPAQSIPYSTIASKMDPYMSQYVEQALNPQLRLQQQQFDAQNRANDSAATSSGAYGDQRAGIQTAQTGEAQDAQRQGLIANAYNTAFNTAIGAGAQDVSNQNNVNTTNANFNETALGRGLGALNSQEALTQFLQQIGAVQQQQQQAKLNVPYSDYLAGTQYPFLTTQLLNQVVGTGAGAMPASSNGTGQSVTSQPDNSGFGVLGSVLGSVGAAAVPFMANGGAITNFGNTGGTGGGLGGFYADGGAVSTPGKPVIVGERGPEVFIPHTTGMVVPNEVLHAAAEKKNKKLSGRTTRVGLPQ